MGEKYPGFSLLPSLQSIDSTSHEQNPARSQGAQETVRGVSLHPTHGVDQGRRKADRHMAGMFPEFHFSCSELLTVSGLL